MWRQVEKARRKQMDPAARHSLHQADARRLPQLTSAAKLHNALQQDEWTSVTRSQVRRALTAANKRDRPAFIEEDRSRRRSIQKCLSATRPAAYPARLQRKREAEREARRPQLEARRLERAQKAVQRAAAVRVAQWAYDTCHAEEQQARALGGDDLWYLRERRLDAGSALKIARGSNETPRWELPAPKRGPVYRHLHEWERLRAATAEVSSDTDAPSFPLPPSQSEPSPPLASSAPIPSPPPTALFNRSFRNLRSRLPPAIDDGRIISALRDADGHAGLALESLNLVIERLMC